MMWPRKQRAVITGLLVAVIAVAALLSACSGKTPSAPAGPEQRPGQEAKAPGAAAQGEQASEEQKQETVEQKALRKVRIAYTSPTFVFLPLFIAQEKDLYRKYGLDVELVMMKSGPAVAAINSGEVEFGSATTTAIQSAQQGLPVKVIFVSNRVPSFFLVSRPEIKTAEALKGKVVGLAGGLTGANATSLKFMLRKLGLDPDKDVTLIDSKDAATLMQAMKSGNVFAGPLAPPWPVTAKKEGYNILAKTSDAIDEFPLGGLVAADKTLQEKRDLAKAVINAQLDALQLIWNDRAATVDVIMKVFNLSKEEAEGSYDLSMEVNAYTKDGLGSDKGISFVMEVNKEEGNVPVVPVEKAADFSILKEVLKERGLLK